MKNFVTIAVLFVLTLATSQAWAADCYSKAEAEADQAIRIHSELMVIGLNCQHMGQRQGLDLYGDYRKFTAKHAALFANYEQTLMSFYERIGQSPMKGINDIRTRYANSISQSASKIRPDVFCAKYSDRIEQTKNMVQSQIRKWASSVNQSHPVSYPLCEG
ncbi:hypothetical protein N9Z27_00105 [Alphaproteobacteria bacterium]|nr:hypothetical protein [Alphaproteobacteria bacterium]